MTLALILFAFTYCLMLALPRFRPAGGRHLHRRPPPPRSRFRAAPAAQAVTIGISLRSMTNLIQKPSSAPQLEG